MPVLADKDVLKVLRRHFARSKSYGETEVIKKIQTEL